MHVKTKMANAGEHNAISFEYRFGMKMMNERVC